MRLIINGDDLGYSPAVNQAFFDLCSSGLLTSASLVVNLPHSAAAMEGARERPGLATGIHLNLTKGRPCLPPRQVQTLVRRDGEFYASPTFFARALAVVAMAEAEAEVRVQIERVLAAGIRPTHLDSHSHWHALPGFSQLIQGLAAEYRVPAVRQADARRALLPNPLWLSGVREAPAAGQQSGPVQPDYLLSLHHWLDGAGEASPWLTGRRVSRLLGRPGITAELVVHPGRADDPHFPPDTLPAERRQRELEFLQSPAFADFLQGIGAEITGRPPPAI